MSYHTSHNLTWQSDTPTENEVLAELAQMMHPDAPTIGQALLDETYNLINGAYSDASLPPVPLTAITPYLLPTCTRGQTTPQPIPKTLATSSRVHPSQAHHHGALRHDGPSIQFPG